MNIFWENINECQISENSYFKSCFNKSIKYVYCGPELKFIFVVRFLPIAIPIISTVTLFYSKFSLLTFRAFVMMCVYLKANTIMSK